MKKYSPVEEATIRDHALELYEALWDAKVFFNSLDGRVDLEVWRDLYAPLSTARAVLKKIDTGPEPTLNPMDMDSDLSMTATNVISRCCDAPVRGSYGSEMYRCAECGLSPCETYEVAK